MAGSRRHHRSTRGAGREGRFRIIGGEWRSRRLPVPEGGDVRPTPDRVRESVFNWLAPLIEGARCLDLYAGSGALGLEALSRGAADVVLVDRVPAVVRQLDANLDLLDCARGRTVCMEAMRFLDGAATPFDVVFVDPPYRLGLPALAVARLVERGWLAPGAQVYVEHEADAPPPDLPAGWRYRRSAAAGQVRYHLAIQEADAAGES